MKLKVHGLHTFGFSLAEVMVAVGISGFLLLVANQMLSDVNKWMADISVDSELVEISQLISARVNCEKTKDALGITVNMKLTRFSRHLSYAAFASIVNLSYSAGLR